MHKMFKYYKLPFKVDEYCSTRIIDGEGKHIIDVRGWGYLQYIKDGAEIQDCFAEHLVDTMNQYWEKENESN